MRRSEVDRSIDQAIEFFGSLGFPLPLWACWTPEEWKTKGLECKEIPDAGLGWDVIDFGMHNFKQFGRTIFNLRNGSLREEPSSKIYCEKAMFLCENQKPPIHYHEKKMEDIINRGGGNVIVTLWKATDDGKLSEEPLEVSISGILKEVAAGEEIRLITGESICLRQRLYHQFWSEPGIGPTLSIEISSVCNDLNDNFWLDPKIKRFPPISEDESPRYVLHNEYPSLTH